MAVGDVDIPAELLSWLGPLLGVVFMALGAVVGQLIRAKVDLRTVRVAAAAAQNVSDNALIDQLQEELHRYRDATDQRLTKLEGENRAYRSFIFIQRDFMRAGGLTPPAWPDNIPR